MKSKEYQNGFNSGSYKDNPHHMGTSEKNDFERGVHKSRNRRLALSVLPVNLMHRFFYITVQLHLRKTLLSPKFQ